MSYIPGSIPLAGFIAPTDSTDTFATHDSVFGRGGWREVASVAERDAITADRLREGCIVFTADTSSNWQYIGGAWTLFQSGSSGNFVTLDTTQNNISATKSFTGSFSLHKVSTSNQALGINAMKAVTTGTANIAIGSESLKKLTEGNLCTAVGYSVMSSMVDGSNNTALGVYALNDAATLSDNTAIGTRAAGNIINSSSNTIVGSNAFNSTYGGSCNSSLGANSMYSSSGDNNVAVGFQSLRNNKASNSVALGSEALMDTLASSGCVGIGSGAGKGLVANDKLYINNSTAPASACLIYGDFVTGDVYIRNSKVITEATVPASADLSAYTPMATTRNLTGQLVHLTGNESISGTKTFTSAIVCPNEGGSSNLRIGAYSMQSPTPGNNHIAIGESAMYAATSNTTCLAIGNSAMANLSGGSSNIAIGNFSLNALKQGHRNIAIGGAMSQCTSSNYNLAIGGACLSKNVGSENVAIGDQTMNDNTIGNKNVMVGLNSGQYNITGSGNVFIGYAAGYDQNISNALIIANTNTINHVYSEFGTDTFKVNNKQMASEATVASLTGQLALDANTVHMTGNESISGTKTFTSATIHTGTGHTTSRSTYNRTDVSYGAGDFHIGLSDQGSQGLAIRNGSSSTDLVTCTSGGKLLIGTVSAAAATNQGKLLVSDSTSDVSAALGSMLPQATIYGGNTNNRLEFGMDNRNATAVGFIQSRNTGTGAANFSLNPGGGNIGIGTATPTAKLSVNGTSSTSGLATFSGGITAPRGTGSYNEGYGGLVFPSMTSGTSNTTVGFQSMYANSVGSYNSSLGVLAHCYNTSGSYNSAVGYVAQQNNTVGSYNSAIGSYASFNNINASYNSACGYAALFNNISGSYNCGFGYLAGYSGGLLLDGNTYCTFLGSNTTSTVNQITNSTALGSGAILTQSNQIVLGNSSIVQSVIAGGSLKMNNVATVPTAVAGTGSLFISGGALYFIGGSGTISLIAPA